MILVLSVRHYPFMNPIANPIDMLLANGIPKLEAANPAIFSLPSIPGVCVIILKGLSQHPLISVEVYPSLRWLSDDVVNMPMLLKITQELQPLFL